MNVRWVVAALAAALTGCSDDSPPNRAGTVTFTYTGAPRSPFAVTGAMPIGEEQAENSSWAVGLKDPTQGTLVFGQRVVGNASGGTDILFLGVDLSTTGTSTITGESDCDNAVCAGMALFVDEGFLCGLNTGAVTVTEVSSLRMKGEFNGTGICENFAASTTDTTEFTVTAGTFDVHLQTDQILVGLRSSSLRASSLRRVRSP